MKNALLVTVYALLMLYITVDIIHKVNVEPKKDSFQVVNEFNPASLYKLPRYEEESPEVQCLAENIFHEARNQSLDGIYAVAYVTINRKNSINYPNTICEVVYEPYQFSWTHENKSIDFDNAIEFQAWKTSVDIAMDVMHDDVPMEMLGVMYYHANTISPRWVAYKTKHSTIQDHTFYVSAN